MTRIGTLRKAAKLTQKEFAERLNTTRSTVAMWETGKSQPRADKLAEIAKLLGCTIDQLFDEMPA